MSTHFSQFSRKIKQVHPTDRIYLERLSQIPQPPQQIYYLGKIPKQPLPTVAIVGSRRPTSYGREVTSQLASRLAQRGVVVVSGLALGIDAIAHQAAVDAGGTTIAVQANGLHDLTPRTNRQLGQAIIEQGGAIISEHPAGTEALPHNFLTRNRLVSGLADTVIVTEAAARSGTLNTAAHALEQGRQIYAVPGNITSPMSAGCNHLIAQGAQPLTSIDRFLEDYIPSPVIDQQPTLPLGRTELENHIVSKLAEGVRDGDEILRTSNATAAELNAALTMLEVDQVIKALGSNKWRLS